MGQEAAEAVAVIGAVGQAEIGGRQRAEQGGGRAQIAELAGGDQEGDRPSLPVDDGVDLGGASAARAADGLGESPPFPPAAQR